MVALVNIRLAFSLILAWFAGGSFQMAHTPRLSDMYECHIITDVEVSVFGEDDFQQIESDDFMALVARGKRTYTPFEPAFQVNLYDDEGIRYCMYVSRSCRFLRIDSNYFKLSRGKAKRLKKIMLQ